MYMSSFIYLFVKYVHLHLAEHILIDFLLRINNSATLGIKNLLNLKKYKIYKKKKKKKKKKRGNFFGAKK